MFLSLQRMLHHFWNRHNRDVSYTVLTTLGMLGNNDKFHLYLTVYYVKLVLQRANNYSDCCHQTTNQVT